MERLISFIAGTAGFRRARARLGAAPLIATPEGWMCAQCYADA
jgi:hypothetical protein